MTLTPPAPAAPCFSAQFICQALGLNPGDFAPKALQTTVFSTITTDSRPPQPGALFVALPGDHYDGHDFLQAALEQGAQGLLLHRGAAGDIPPGVLVFRVADTLQAYRQLSQSWRQQFTLPVVAIAGSVGKTTTKELLAALSLGKWPLILKTQGSENGFVGIPKTLLKLTPDHGVALIEIGIDAPHSMAYHLATVQPTHAVLTRIGPEHLEGLGSLEVIAFEEGQALEWVAQHGGEIAFPTDDPWIKPPTAAKPSQIWNYTVHEQPQPQAGTTQVRLTGHFAPEAQTLEILGLETALNLSLPLPGRHNADNLLAAVAMATSLKLTPTEISRGLPHFQGLQGRSQVKRLANGVQLIADYYNAQPTSMEAGFALLQQLTFSQPTTHTSTRQGKRRAWAVLGDMLELGVSEESLHRALATSLLRLKIDNILLLGACMAFLADELQKRGFPGTLKHYTDRQALASELKQGVFSLQASDVVLVKGSRGMKMEEIAAAIEAQGLESKNSVS